MKIEQELAREAGKSLILLMICIVVLAVLIYLVLQWTDTPIETKSIVQIDSVAAQTGRPTKESAEYRALLEKYNRTESEKAREEGQSFVARIREGTEENQKPSPASLPDENRYAPPPVTEQEKGSAFTETGANEHRRKAIDTLLQELNAQWQPVAFQGAPLIEGGEAVSEGTWTDSVAQPSTAPLPLTGNDITEKAIVPPYTRVPAVIETAVDSDNPEPQVLAKVPTGAYAGAQLQAKRVQLVGDGLSIHFERMSWRGQTYAVEAYALDEKTLQSSVASTVNHRYFSRIILPAVAMGMGRAGQLFEQANTQNTITPQGTAIQTRPSNPDGRAIAGTIVGGIGQQAAQVMTHDAARLPIQQVTLHRGHIIAIQFMGGVYEKDNLRLKSERAK